MPLTASITAARLTLLNALRKSTGITQASLLFSKVARTSGATAKQPSSLRTNCLARAGRELEELRTRADDAASVRSVSPTAIGLTPQDFFW